LWRGAALVLGIVRPGDNEAFTAHVDCSMQMAAALVIPALWFTVRDTI
jgi:hypothetical protein